MMARRPFMDPAERFPVHLAVQVALVAAVLLGYGCQTGSAHRVTTEEQLAGAINRTTPVVTIAGDIVLTKPLPLILNSISIKGACGGRKCVVDGAGKYGIFHAYGSPDQCSVTIENLILRNAADGAYSGKCNLVLKSVDLKDNGDERGAVVIGLGSATWHIVDCLFEGNRATSLGGALLVTSWGTGRVTRTTFKSNRAAENGGAVYIQAQPPNKVGTVFDHVTFDSNTAGQSGGGMYVAGTSQDVVKVFVSSCKFTKNVATGSPGGGLALSNLIDARICHTSIAGGGNTAKGGEGNDMALLYGNYYPQMTVSFCPAQPNSLSLFVTPVPKPPITRHHCKVCALPK